MSGEIANEDLKGRELAALYDGLRQTIDGLPSGDERAYAEAALSRAKGYRKRLRPESPQEEQ